jgi:hypothetical protein
VVVHLVTVTEMADDDHVTWMEGDADSGPMSPGAFALCAAHTRNSVFDSFSERAFHCWKRAVCNFCAQTETRELGCIVLFLFFSFLLMSACRRFMHGHAQVRAQANMRIFPRFGFTTGGRFPKNILPRIVGLFYCHSRIVGLFYCHTRIVGLFNCHNRCSTAIPGYPAQQSWPEDSLGTSVHKQLLRIASY